MPHSTQHEIHELDGPENNLAIQEYSSRSNGFGHVYKGKGHQPLPALNQLGPYEIDGTPVEQRRNAITSQRETPDMIPILSEARRNLEVAFQEYNHLYWTYRQTGVWLEAQGIQLATAIQENLAQPLLAAVPEHVPYDDFIQLLETEGLTWLMEHVDRLDGMANFAVASTAEFNKKRCKVGRPRGKILKREQNDDLVRRLCCFHWDEVGFHLQVNGQHRDPWTCWPPNADEDVDVDME
jgi:hypothetical protein